MIQIDKTDTLYKYLTNLGVDDIDSLYKELADNGRYKINDVKQYFMALFSPSQTKDIEETELERLVDYYGDLKKIKTLTAKQIKECLNEYKQTPSVEVRDLILNSQLKDIMYMCVNYKTLHETVDIQDLVQVANMGLLIAIEKYKPDAKIDFKDYVIFWVRNSILNEFKGEINDK